MAIQTLNLGPHQQYELFNTATRQTARFEILESYAYKGQYMIYGERMRQGIWVPATIGRVQAPPGPACFPLFLTEDARNIELLVSHLRSLPLYLVLPDEQVIPLLTLENSYLIMGGHKGVKDDMIQRARQLIDLYLEWEPAHVVPEWFWLKQKTAAMRN